MRIADKTVLDLPGQNGCLVVIIGYQYMCVLLHLLDLTGKRNRVTEG